MNGIKVSCFPRNKTFKEILGAVNLTFSERDIYDTQNSFFDRFHVFGDQSLRFILDLD